MGLRQHLGGHTQGHRGFRLQAKTTAYYTSETCDHWSNCERINDGRSFTVADFRIHQSGASLPLTMSIIGRDASIERLRLALDYVGHVREGPAEASDVKEEISPSVDPIRGNYNVIEELKNRGFVQALTRWVASAIDVLNGFQLTFKVALRLPMPPQTELVYTQAWILRPVHCIWAICYPCSFSSIFNLLETKC